ncbi:MAG TPA: TonB-dependent siderophore receptor [Candidatus Solibacter sp.]|nr:TonB-dependent siderophore receptor [Candidatus Solibacter sp.]
MNLSRLVIRAGFSAIALLAAATYWSRTAAAEETAEPPCEITAQSELKQVNGSVVDSSGAAIAGATITATCTTFSRSGTTDAAGNFTLMLPAGKYHLRVEASNFAAAEREISVPGEGEPANLRFTLSVASMRNQVVVTAEPGYAVTETTAGSKMEEPLLEVPQAITVVNRELLDDQGAYKLDDALKNVAGVIPGGYYEAWDYYRIRGFDASFNTFVDGLRGGNGMNEETFGLESVEVMKGPSSTLYGQSVLGGIVNVRSKRPRPDTFATVQFTGGSYGFYEPAIDAGTSLNHSHTVYARLNLLYRPTDSFVDYVSRRRVYVAPALTWEINPDTRLTILSRYQHDTGHLGFPLPAVGTVLPNPNGEIPVSLFVGEPSNPNPVSEVNKQIGYEFTHRFSDSATFYQNVRLDWYENHWDKILYPAYLDADDRTLFRYPLSWKGNWADYAVDTGVRFRTRTGRFQHSLVAGVDYYREPNKYSGESIDFSDPAAYMPLDVFNPVYGTPFSPLQPYASGETRTRYVGLYLQDQMQLTERLSLTAGGRVDFSSNRDLSEPDSNDHSAFSPRVGVDYRLLPGVALYASYSKSFLPQSGRLFDGSSSGSFVSPETGDQWEGGLKTSLLSGRMVNTISIYRLTRSNVLTSDPNHPNFYLLTGTQRSRGAEFETTYRLQRAWNVSLAYSHTDATVVRDNDIPVGTPTQNVPKNSFNAWTTYELPRGPLQGLGFGFGGRYYTDQSGDLLNTFQLPAYGLVDASIFYRRGHLSWQLNAYNLADTRYFTGSYNDVYVQPGSPRVFHTMIRWSF